MSYNTEKWLCIGLIVLVAWLVLSNLHIHTGAGDELSSRNNGINVSISLFGDSTVDTRQEGAQK